MEETHQSTPTVQRDGLLDRVKSTRLYGKTRGAALLARYKLGLPHTVEFDGTTAKFYHDGLQGYYSVVNSLREEPVIQHILDSVRADDVFYDIGANLGFYSCLVARHVPGVSVVAFEPYPPNVRLLRKNLTRNAVDATVVPYALADERGEATFTTMQTAEGGAQEAGIDNDHLRGRSDRPASESTVETVPGDQLVADGEIPQPTVIKMDAEGVGGAVLRGLEHSLRDDRTRLVYVEPHENEEELETLLGTYGFELDYIPLKPRVADAFILGRRD